VRSTAFTPEHVSRLRWWRPSSSPRAGPRREPRGSRCRSRLPCPGDPYVANALVRFPASSSGAAHHTRHGTEMIYRLVGHTPARARSRTICCWAQALPELRTRSARRSAGTSHTTTYTRATLVPSASSPAARIDRNRLPAGRVAREWFGDRRPSLSCPAMKAIVNSDPTPTVVSLPPGFPDLGADGPYPSEMLSGSVG